MIETDLQLQEIIKQINSNIQAACDYIGPDDPDKYDGLEYLIRIPRGYIRKTNEHKKGLKVLNDTLLIKNISYSLILSDFYCWLLNRTDISITVREMIIKSGITLYSAIMESLLRVEPFKNIRRTQSFPKRLDAIQNAGFIDDSLKEDLLWLWKAREGIHLYILDEPEYNKYHDSDYNKAAHITEKLLNRLEEIKK